MQLFKWTSLSSQLTCLSWTNRVILRKSSSVAFVPSHEPVCESDVTCIQNFINSSDRMVILTGAGISTESGLPDYRSKSVGLLNRPDYKPIVLQEFISSELRRRSYWARNFMAWENFKRFQPNTSHLVIASWQKEKPDRISAIVTQNVDRLHQKAGATDVIELHGHGYSVACLKCDYTIDREIFQRHLEQHNNHLLHLINPPKESSRSIRPDGDIEIENEIISLFKTPLCPDCGNLLKPTIVFFGDNVPKVTVDKVYSAISSSDSLLVIGSSLHVYSGYRFVAKAHELQKNISIINIGPTRADNLDKITFIRKKSSDILSKVKI